jgi:hypothetical protein
MKSDQMFGLLLTNALMPGNFKDQRILQKSMKIHGRKLLLSKKSKKEFNLRKNRDSKKPSFRLLLIKKLPKKLKLLRSIK